MKKMIALLVAMAFLTTAVAFANHGGYSKDSKADLEQKVCYKAGLIKMYGEKAGLTEEQVQQAKDLKYKTKKQVIEMDAKIESLKLDIWQEMYKDSADQAKIDALIDQKYDVKRAKAKVLVSAYLTLKNIPTKEQWDMIKSEKHSKKW